MSLRSYRLLDIAIIDVLATLAASSFMLHKHPILHQIMGFFLLIIVGIGTHHVLGIKTKLSVLE